MELLFEFRYGCLFQRIKQSQNILITVRQVIKFQLILSKLYLKRHRFISFCMDIHSMPLLFGQKELLT